MRMRVLAAMALLLLGCQPAPLTPAGTPGRIETGAERLWGKVATGLQTQATAQDLVSHATVTLLDPANSVVATGLTDGSGAFSLNPFATWAPTNHAVYAVDAVKSFDTTQDRAVLRFRTLVSWDGAQWRSLAGNTAATTGIQLTPRTTALAAIQNIKLVDASALMGRLDPATGAFTPAVGLTTGEVDTVSTLVNQAIAANLDPLKWISYTAGDATYRLRIQPKAGSLLFDLEDALTATDQRLSFVAGRDGGQALSFGNEVLRHQGQIGSKGEGDGLFNTVAGVAIDPAGNLVAADYSKSAIQKFHPNGTFLGKFGLAGPSAGQLGSPHGVSIDAAGNLLITEYANHRVQVFDASGKFRFGIGGGAEAWTVAPTPTASDSHNYFNMPHYAAFDLQGNIWVSDFGNHRILKYSPSGAFLMGIGGGTTWTSAAGNRFASGAGDRWFNNPTGLAFSSSGDLYVSDRVNHRVQRLTSSGGYLGQWGSVGTGDGQFTNPEGIAIDGSGNVWVAEYGGHRLQKFDRTGVYVGKYGSQGYGDGQFQQARGLAFGRDGTLYAADNGGRVHRLLPSTTPLTFPVAGNARVDRGTIRFWIKHDFPLDKINYGVLSIGGHWGDMVGTTNIQSIQIFRYSSNIWYFRMGNDVTAASVDAYDALPRFSSSVIPSGEWTHVAYTWENGAPSMVYVNGKLVAKTDRNVVTPTAWRATGQIIVGRSLSHGWAKATLDGLRIYDYAQSADELARDYLGLGQE